MNGELVLVQSRARDNSVIVTDTELFASLSSRLSDGNNTVSGLDGEERVLVQSVGVAERNEINRTYEVGEVVEGMFRGGERWYSCVIRKWNVDGTYNLAYDDGDEENHVDDTCIRKKK